MSINNCIQLSLNIKEKYLTFEDEFIKKEKIGNREVYVYHATHKPPVPSVCPQCGCINKGNSIIRHGFKQSSILLPPVSGFKTVLKIRKQRFYCKDCNSTFISQTSIVDPRCFISKNTYLSTICDLKEKSSIVDIAKRNHISHGTVNNWHKALNKGFIVRKNFLPKHLSMDEFKSVKSSNAAMSFVLLDSESGQTIDIVEDRRLNNLTRYFMSYSRAARLSVETVCIDMYTPYISLIKTCFPKAVIITDRFHVIQLISRSLNKTRIQLMNRDKKNYNKLKRYWRLFLKNYNELNDDEYKKFTCFSSMMRENDVVNYLVELDKEFYDTYWLYQELLGAFQKKEPDQFFKLLESPSENCSATMKASVSTLLQHRESITNALKYSFSNGKIEGTNNLIKVIKRIAFGYRNFTTFRTRILLVTNTMVRFSIPKSTHKYVSTLS